MFDGLPTSIADASVVTLGRGCQSPPSRNSVTARFSFVASTMSPIGRPASRAHTPAVTLPRLPDGTMKFALRPSRRQTSRLAAA